MDDEVQKIELGAKKAWPAVMKWVAGISALIGFFASVAGGVTWFVNHHRQQTERQAKMVLAEAQRKQGEYQASIQTYGEILKADPFYRPALDEQLDATMEWVENFHILARDDQNAADLAGPALDQIMAILDSGFTRVKGPQAADVQAHIGWAHWLNQQIAEREVGASAEQNLRAALASDPTNVYANAMLGNWLLQNNGTFTEAIQHFNIAVSTGRARPYVRKLQFGGLIYLDKKGARAELIKVANEMRKSGEPIDEWSRTRILTTCFNPSVTHHEELSEALTAVPPDDAWNTYLWLDNKPEDNQNQLLDHDFVKASLLELSGNQQESLEKFRLLQQQLKSQPGSMKDSVDAAVTRLSHS